MYFQCLFLLMQSTGGRSASGPGLRGRAGDASLEGVLVAFFFFFLFGLWLVAGLLSQVGDGSVDEMAGRSSWCCVFSMVMVRCVFVPTGECLSTRIRKVVTMARLILS